MAARLPAQRLFTQTIPSSAFCRTMATSTGTKYDFLVVVPDKPDALQRRLSARPDHFKGIGPLVNSGQCMLGGALLKDIPKDDDVSSLDFWGSTLVIKAESKAQVVEILKNDPYAQADVWDIEKAQILPFKPAFKTTASM